MHFCQQVWFWIFVVGGPLGVPGVVQAAYQNNPYPMPPQPAAPDRLRHELNNQAEEIRVLQARLATQESLIESLRDDICKMGKTSLEATQSDAKTVQARMSDLELKIHALETEFTKANELLGHSKRQLELLGTSVDQQNKNSRHLEKSLGTLLEAVGGDTTEATYCVVTGDSLDKLAKRFKTSVQTLKQLNGLDSDRIVVGKKLKVPSASP